MRAWRAIPFSIIAVSSCGPSGDASRPSSADFVAQAPGVLVTEYVARRAAALEAFSDGILVLHARPAEKTMEQWGFAQDPTFQYFTGLTELSGAILALDGPEGASHLFLPPAPQAFGRTVEGLIPEPGPETASRYGIDSARPWTDFVDWLEGRVRTGATIYLDGARRPETTGAQRVPPRRRAARF